MKTNSSFKRLSLSIVWTWLLLFAFIPFCMIIIGSFMSDSDEHLLSLPFTLDNFIHLYNPIYLRIFQKSFFILGYPFAYIIARMQHRFKNVLILLVIIPFWTSSLIRSYALIALLKAKGIINSFLIALGLIQQPLSILFTDTAVIIGLVYNLLPFMILPLLTNIERLDYRIVDAAHDLGDSRITTFTKILIPLTRPGIIAGSILVFLPAMTLFYIPDILGGAKSILLGNLIQNQFLVAQNWPLGAAVSAMLTLILATLLFIYFWTTRSEERELL